MGFENQFLVFFLSGRLRQVLLYCSLKELHVCFHTVFTPNIWTDRRDKTVNPDQTARALKAV